MTKTLRICIDRWLTVGVKATRNNEFVDELLYGGSPRDSRGTIHVRSDPESDDDRCGWYAARRIICAYAPKNRSILLITQMKDRCDDCYCRHESELSREITDLGLPKAIEDALLQRKILTLEKLLRFYEALDNQANNPLRFIRKRSTAHIPLGQKRLEIIRLKLEQIGVEMLIGYDFDHPDARTRLLIADRRAERRSKQ